MFRSIAQTFAIALLWISAGTANAQTGVVGQLSQGKIRFESIEELQIDANQKVRLVPPSAGKLTQSEFKHISPVELGSIGFIRRQADGRIVRRSLPSGEAEFIVPFDFSPPVTVQLSDLPTKFRIETLHSRKQKQGDEISPEEFFCFLPGPQPDKVVFDILFQDKAFDSPDEQFAAIQGFVASFPSSELKNDLRTKLERIVNDGLDDFENGGSFQNLLAVSKFADVAHTSMPGQGRVDSLYDSTQKKLSFVRQKALSLKSLAAAENWDTFLAAYTEFEPYQSSFGDLVRLRQTALEESARLHAQLGRNFIARKDHAAAVKEISMALSRDPENQIIAKLLDSEKMRDAEAVAQERAAKRTLLVKDSPEDRQFRRNLFLAERSIADGDLTKAESSIHDADLSSLGAPEVLLLRALLLEKAGRFAEALAMLDEHDRSAVEVAERDKGEAIRDQLLYDLAKRRTAARQELADLFSRGNYSKLKNAADQALKLDPNDEIFLYYAAISHTVLNDRGAATDLLKRYLKNSDSLAGDPKERDLSFKLQSLNDIRAPEPGRSGNRDWMSGQPVPSGAMYCPQTAAFQPMIDAVSGYKMHMTFNWEKGRLSSILTSFEDEKGSSNYRALSANHVNPANPPSEQAPGNFFFLYASNSDQVQVVTTSKPAQEVAFQEVNLTTSNDPKNPKTSLVDESGRPRIVLLTSPQFNIAAANVIYGGISTVVAGNSFFNPFIWDGIHYFSSRYDDKGHLVSASEWGSDNTVRFSWDGDRLTAVKAFRHDSSIPYYERTISYSNEGISSEAYSSGSQAGKIRYIYAGSTLQQVRVEDSGVHDGKTWLVRIRP
jgi:tetratricopeptide (TPR) repeat protein